ncbi:MAG: TetR/AcrR family transcriptional regulator [Acidimicrobiales bacterium]|nr:TetR/AcrR family transcriptional regulator [Acidimicrobiales bacterium]
MPTAPSGLRVVDPVPLPAALGGAGPDGQASPHRVRVVDAALACLARYGTAKTTVDDIARQAGLSRATIYRTFPGGREEILAAVVDTEAARFFSALGVRLGEASDLGEALVAGIVEASTRIRDHVALSYLVVHEPETILGHLAFRDSDRLMHAASRFTAPFLARWLRPAEAGRVAEWATRIVLSYALSPSPHTDLCDPEQAAHVVDTYVLPGVRALHRAATPQTTVLSPNDHALDRTDASSPAPRTPSSVHEGASA